MNKLQEQSLQAKDARFLTDIIDDFRAENEANNEETQEKLNELLNRAAQSNAEDVANTSQSSFINNGTVNAKNVINVGTLNGNIKL